MIATTTSTFIAALLALQAAAPPPFPVNAGEILARVRTAYTNPKTYDFAFAATATLEMAGVKYLMVMPGEIARGDGADEPFTQHPQPMLTQKLDGSGELVGLAPGILNGSELAYYEFERIGLEIQYAKLLREEATSVNGKTLRCYVVEVLRRADPLASAHAHAPTPETLWIDKTTFFVLRATFATETSRHELIQWDVAFPSYTLNGPAPEWLAKIKKAKEKHRDQLRSKMVGTEAPLFSLKDLQGKEFALSKTRGQVVLLDFWATWCLPCRPEVAIVDSVEKKWGPKGLLVVRITNEPPEDVETFLLKTREIVPTLVNGEEVWKQYQVFEAGVPAFVLIDPAGKILTYDLGFLTEAELTARLAKAGLH